MIALYFMPGPILKTKYHAWAFLPRKWIFTGYCMALICADPYCESVCKTILFVHFDEVSGIIITEIKMLAGKELLVNYRFTFCDTSTLESTKTTT